jgi:hypothetical protein
MLQGKKKWIEKKERRKSNNPGNLVNEAPSFFNK